MSEGGESKPVKKPSTHEDRPISRYKIDTAKALLAGNPSLTGREVAELLNCGLDTGKRALYHARKEITEHTSMLCSRAKKLKEKKIEKAIESNEAQIASRLDDLRSNAQTLQEHANETGKPADIVAASRAWESLAKYERTVTGIEAEEKRSASAAGATNVAIQVPLDSSDIKFGS